MKAKRILVMLMLCALVFLVFSATAWAKEAVERPLKATLNGQVTWLPWDVAGLPNPGHPPYLYTISHAVGSVSHLGRTVMDSYHATPDGYTFGPGYLILVAANGDKVYMTYYGNNGDFNPGAPAGTVFHIPTTFTITGGTGRFSGASGSGTLMALLTYPGFLGGPDPWHATWKMAGTISY